jgi:hypothetical protein
MSDQEVPVLKEKSEIASLLTHTDLNTQETREKPSRKFPQENRHQHIVGQLEQNIDKVLKILTKTQFNEQINIR